MIGCGFSVDKIKQTVRIGRESAKALRRKSAFDQSVTSSNQGIVMSKTETAIDGAVDSVNKTLKDFQENITTAFNQMYAHVETMAAHIIVLESLIGDLAGKAGIDHAKVEDYIKKRIELGTDGSGKADDTLVVARDLMQRLGIDKK